MQRHWHDDVGVGNHVLAGPRHHAPQRQRQLDPVAVFESVHQLAGNTIVAGDRAGAAEDRRVGHGGRRQKRRAQIDRKRRAEPLAERPLDEADAAPTLGAQAMRIGHRAPARDA
jgi:hypothetical protein